MLRRVIKQHERACPKCGRVVQKTNKAHEGSPICVVTAANATILERGLAFVEKRWHASFRKLGVPLEEHPHRTEFTPNRRQVRNGEKGAAEQIVHGSYAPRWAVLVTVATAWPMSVREDIIRYGLQHPDWAVALGVVQKLGGDVGAMMDEAVPIYTQHRNKMEAKRMAKWDVKT